MEGIGILLYDDGQFYLGEFKNNCKHGYGIKKY